MRSSSAQRASEKGKNMRFYHVTETTNVESIRRLGLLPSIGAHSKSVSEPEPLVYLFPCKGEMEYHLYGGLGAAFLIPKDDSSFDFPDLSVICVDVNLFEIPVAHRSDNQVWEFVCKEPIPPSCIVSVEDIDVDNAWWFKENRWLS